MVSSGQCLCGSVSFKVEMPTNWMAHCHCTLCQKAHGSAFVTWVGVNKERVIIDDSENSLTWFKSSKNAERGFCDLCGSSLFFRSENWANELHIVRANFTGALDREPQSHGYYDTHVSWFSVNDNLQKKPTQTN
ncbi:MAG: hypothetical protein COB38_07560 [Gammaproteobacteria bacterium]|nr:MAG: hypothetical protein COB38_07560 [Gammaproteobacteria bacterium]